MENVVKDARGLLLGTYLHGLYPREGGSMRILQEANSLLVALDMGQTNGG